MIKTCPTCHANFRTKDSRRKFCGVECYRISQVGRPSGRDMGGRNNPNWKGGRRIDKDGYILVYFPQHPFCNGEGYVREHRLVIEKKLKRFLSRDEIVHHLNGNKSDNRIENLQALDRKEHDRMNALDRRNKGFLIEKHSPTLNRLGWALNYKKCVSCGTSANKHHAKGLCKACYQKKSTPFLHVKSTVEAL